jgi:CubicO group peptidase (beta-lactamase class C family)
VFLGEVIERATGQTFRDHMNTVVLPELGMADSQFGASTRADLTLAEPSIDVVLPLSIVIAVCTLIAGPLLLGHALLMRIFKWTRPLAASVPQHAIVLFALGCAAFALYRMFGWQNWPALALPSGFLLVLAVGAWKLVSLRVGGARIAGVCIAIFLVALLVLRPAVPLAERKPIALPAAGLRTTAGDYARFLSYLVTAARTDATFAEMVRPQVFVNPQQDWGLGVGLQHNGARIAWHWGVNFPGYQALAVVDVETGDVMVVLMNGGALSFSPEGYRFSGLELARNAVVAIQGGRHSAYWQGVQ